MKSRHGLLKALGIAVALVLLGGVASVDAAPRKSKKSQKKKSVSPLVDLDAILDKEARVKKKKARPQALGELLDPRRIEALVDAKLDEVLSVAGAAAANNR